MAPRETPKATPKVQRSAVKTIAAKNKSSPAVNALKKIFTSTSKKTNEKIPLKMNNTTVEPRKRTTTVPKVSTPKPKENKSVPLPASAAKSAKKPKWKCRPKPAHSGVPVPEKMKMLLMKDLNDSL